MTRRTSIHPLDLEAASTTQGGGCFFALFTPLTIVLLAILISRMLTGETTRPWDLLPSAIDQGLPSSSHPVAILPADQGEDIGIAPFFSHSVQYWETDILRWADDFDLDPNLVATVMQIESCGDPRALSHAGAMGLFQVMPYHFETGEDPYKPNTNAKRGLGYFRQSLDTHISPRLAMAGYNGGIKTASKPENLWPQETIRYAYWGSGIYQEAQAGEILPVPVSRMAGRGARVCVCKPNNV